MPVDQEIAVRRVLILAHARFRERSITKGRETLGEKLAHLCESCIAHPAVFGIRVACGAVAVEGYLESPILDVWDSVRTERIAEIDPRRKSRRSEPRVAGRRSEVEYFLSGRKDPVPECVWEQLRQPGSASEHDYIGESVR